MKINVFEKHVQPRNGNKGFTKFITTLTNKNGERIYADVRFAKGCKEPSIFPCAIDFDKHNANLSKRVVYKGTDHEKEAYTIWIKEYREELYEDDSLNDFD